MINDNNRHLFFIFGCIGSRLILTYLAFFYVDLVKYLTLLTIPIGLSFMFLALTGFRQNAFEAGGVVWWSDMRIFHSILYLVFSFLAINTKTRHFAYKTLLVDTLLGVSVWLNHRLKYI